MLVFFNFLFGIQHDLYHIGKLEFSLLYFFLSIFVHYYYPKLVFLHNQHISWVITYVPVLMASSPDFLNSRVHSNIYSKLLPLSYFCFFFFCFFLFYIHKNFILHLGSKSNFISSWSISLVLSVEQSSTIIISQSDKVWFCTDCIVSPINLSALKEGVMTETKGEEDIT